MMMLLLLFLLLGVNTLAEERSAASSLRSTVTNSYIILLSFISLLLLNNVRHSEWDFSEVMISFHDLKWFSLMRQTPICYSEVINFICPYLVSKFWVYQHNVKLAKPEKICWSIPLRVDALCCPLPFLTETVVHCYLNITDAPSRWSTVVLIFS